MTSRSLAYAPVIGHVGPMPDGRDGPFWDGLERGRLMIQRCPACATWIWGPQWNCPECHRFSPDWTEVQPHGRVFTWTRTWQNFTPEFAELTPYVTVVVELPQAGGRRLLGLLLAFGDDALVDPVLGEELEGVFQPAGELTGGAAVLRWRRPSAADNETEP
ncbi:MAG: Zn-ribbon domain-containing OB-fold protein [Solirubrobacteraceae bacterium]